MTHPRPEVALLAPIARPTLTDEIVRRLVGYILDAGLKPGAKLPSERELMAQLGVTTFVEFGPGRVNAALIRRIAKGVKTESINTAQALGGPTA